MEGQEFIITAIEEKVETGELDWVKTLNCSSLFPIQEFPAVIVEEGPFDYSLQAKNQIQTAESQKYNVMVLIESENRSTWTQVNYKSRHADVKDKMDKLVEYIIERAKTYDKVSKVMPDKGEIDEILIDAMPVTVLTVGVEVYLGK